MDKRSQSSREAPSNDHQPTHEAAKKKSNTTSSSSSSQLFWVNKTAKSKHLSRSNRAEHSEIFRHVHAMRLKKCGRLSRVTTSSTTFTKMATTATEQETLRSEVGLQQQALQTGGNNWEDDVLCQVGWCDTGEIGSDSSSPASDRPDRNSAFPVGNTSTSSIIAQMVSLPSWSTEEKRAFHFFLDQRRLSKQRISLARPDDLKLWDVTIPMGAELHPFVRNLLVAVASFHETLYIEKTDRARTISLRILAYEYSTKAAEMLRSSSENLSDDWLIITCILFIRLHMFKSDFVGANKYLDAALRFYERIKTESNISNTTVRRLHRTGIHQTIRTMRVHSLLNGWGTEPTLEPDQPLRFSLPELSMPFSSLDQIRDCVEMLNIIPVQIIKNLSESAYLDPDSALAKDFFAVHASFEYWWEEFRNREILNANQTIQYVRNLRPTTNSFVNMPYMLFQCIALAADETTFDLCKDRFANMTATVRMFLEENNETLFNIHHFTPVTVKALWFTATCCRDPVIRREAILLLRTYNRQESGIDSWTAGVVADKLMVIEEEGLMVRCANDVPENRRIRFVSCTYVPEERKVKLQFKRIHEPTISEAWMELDALLKHDAVSEEDAARFQALSQLCACYTKVETVKAPRGYLRPMIYNGQEMAVINQQDEEMGHKFDD